MTETKQNKEFEDLLFAECKKHLKESINHKHYADMTLDSLYHDGKYIDDGGDENYYEIPARDSKDGLPHVVSC